MKTDKDPSEMKRTQPLPRIPDPSLPRTPAPRRIDESNADPHWLAAMEALHRQFCERNDR